MAPRRKPRAKKPKPAKVLGVTKPVTKTELVGVLVRESCTQRDVDAVLLQIFAQVYVSGIQQGMTPEGARGKADAAALCAAARLNIWPLERGWNWDGVEEGAVDRGYERDAARGVGKRSIVDAVSPCRAPTYRTGPTHRATPG